MKNIKSTTVLLIISFSTLLTGCVQSVATNYVTMEAGPAPEIVAESGKAQTLPAGFIKRRLRLGYPSLKDIVINDRTYLYITKNWFQEVMERTEVFILAQVPEVGGPKGYPVGYEETLALLATNAANMSVARRYKLNASVLIGVMTANSDKAWGSIPADGKSRTYVICLTEHDGVVYDVRTKQMVEFNNFPNLESMRGIFF